MITITIKQKDISLKQSARLFRLTKRMTRNLKTQLVTISTRVIDIELIGFLRINNINFSLTGI